MDDDDTDTDTAAWSWLCVTRRARPNNRSIGDKVETQSRGSSNRKQEQVAERCDEESIVKRWMTMMTAMRKCYALDKAGYDIGGVV
jgi:hypothetical protein